MSPSTSNARFIPFTDYGFCRQRGAVLQPAGRYRFSISRCAVTPSFFRNFVTASSVPSTYADRGGRGAASVQDLADWRGLLPVIESNPPAEPPAKQPEPWRPWAGF
jgi:hypothetical protein